MDRTLALAADGPDSEAAAVSPPPNLTLEAIYDAHIDFVWRCLRRMGIPSDRMDDAAQDVFLVVHRRLSDFAHRSSVKTWLFRIVVHVAHDYRRSQRRKSKVIREDIPQPLESMADRVSNDPQRQAEHADAIRLLETLLERVGEEKREVFLLSELEEMTAPEISETLGISLTTVYSRLRSARSEFDEALALRYARESGGSHGDQ
jgi:RNA polymerase sigma-70 factor, ECF subfamily